MLLSEVKQGKVYACIEDYSRKVNNQYCQNLPDANPVLVVEKKLVPVGGTDACNRPINRRKTVLVCRQYKIVATDPLAQDLDVVEENHPDLVVDTEDIEAGDLVWEWDKEVVKAREDAERALVIDRYFDYMQGASARVLRHQLSRRCLTNLLGELRDDVKNYPKVTTYVELVSRHAEFKQYLYDVLTPDRAPRSVPQIHYGIRIESTGNFDPRYSHGWDRDMAEKRRVGLKVDLSIPVRFSFLLSGAAFFGEEERFYQDRDDYFKHVKVRDAINRRILSASPEEQQAIADLAVEQFAEYLTSGYGIRLPKFNPNKSWKTWRRGEMDKLDVIIPKSRKPEEEE